MGVNISYIHLRNTNPMHIILHYWYLNSTWYNQTHSLIELPYLMIIASTGQEQLIRTRLIRSST